MADYRIAGGPPYGHARVVTNEDGYPEARFGGLRIAYSKGRNRFYLRDPHSDGRAILYDSDMHGVLAFILDHYEPWGDAIRAIPDSPQQPMSDVLPEDSERCVGLVTLAVMEWLWGDAAEGRTHQCWACDRQRERAAAARQHIKAMLGASARELLSPAGREQALRRYEHLRGLIGHY